MSVFVMADLHLSAATDKPMDIFGARWQDHTEKIRKNWTAIVTDDDTVVIPGDISWGMTLDEALPDLLFLESLPGTKIIGKGNHDYWWSTATKLNTFFEEHGIKSVRLLHNNAIETEDFIIAGTRGWYVEERLQNTPNDTDYEKIVAREVQRLEISLKEAAALREATGKEILAFFHFPPVFAAFICEPLVKVLSDYGVTRAFYGHIHGEYRIPRSRVYEGIRFSIVSADYLDFVPMITFPE